MEVLEERFKLAKERILSLCTEPVKEVYFAEQFQFAKMMIATYEWIKGGDFQNADLETLSSHNERLYADILPEHYQKSFCNPEYADSELGVYGKILCLVAAEMRAMIPACYEQQLEGLLIRLELLLEIYGCFADCLKEGCEGPKEKELQEIVYWYFSDYTDEAMKKRIGEQIDPSYDFAVKIVTACNLSDNRFLYQYGEYVSEDELETADYFRKLPEEKIKLIADTFTEGYRIGFELAEKDLSRKKTVNIRYCLGYERIIRAAIDNFKIMKLQPTIYRQATSLLENKGFNKIGYYGGTANRQFDYDHKEDLGLILDKKYVQRKLDVMKKAYEEQREWADYHAGPAVMEVFGEADFEPLNKKTAVRLSEKQQKLSVEYASGAGRIVNEYIKGEERSFTIIAFPSPAIARDEKTGLVDRAGFEEIFNEIIRINTLDYNLYRTIQQKIIDVLDEADYVLIKGMGKNQTNMKVKLHKLSDKAHETNFENCVADVNIPVGEVFTSPLLTGTEGLLHVTSVFLNGLKYENLKLKFEDGCVTEYSCTNFETKGENEKLIKDTVLFHHDTLPIGEFAIGTNTTAYVAANRLGIADKLPILIAEKMGPHFAVGDTCYSHAEDVIVKNPDGKEIIARDNEKSMLRKTCPEKAYFNCHTDITIPYNELGELSIVKEDGSVVVIIEGGRFVLPGTEELNIPFQN